MTDYSAGGGDATADVDQCCAQLVALHKWTRPKDRLRYWAAILRRQREIIRRDPRLRPRAHSIASAILDALNLQEGFTTATLDHLRGSMTLRTARRAAADLVAAGIAARRKRGDENPGRQGGCTYRTETTLPIIVIAADQLVAEGKMPAWRGHGGAKTCIS